MLLLLLLLLYQQLLLLLLQMLETQISVHGQVDGREGTLAKETDELVIPWSAFLHHCFDGIALN